MNLKWLIGVGVQLVLQRDAMELQQETTEGTQTRCTPAHQRRQTTLHEPQTATPSQAAVHPSHQHTTLLVPKGALCSCCADRTMSFDPISLNKHTSHRRKCFYACNLVDVNISHTARQVGCILAILGLPWFWFQRTCGLILVAAIPGIHTPAECAVCLVECAFCSDEWPGVSA